MKPSSSWIVSPRFDLIFIIGPGLFASVLATELHNRFPQWQNLSPILWLALVVFVDVAHVYSTALRTYILPSEWIKHPLSFRLVPLCGFAVAVLLHTLSAEWFWRALAYLAVFHFVRQQYGFFRLYQNCESVPRWKAEVDRVAIYLTTLLPLWIWHTEGLKGFHWFRSGDFLYFPQTSLAEGGRWFALIWWSFYLATEGWLWSQTRKWSWPKNLFMLSSFAAWWIGIVQLQTDMAFSITNILAHGIPYFALVYVFGKRLSLSQGQQKTWLGFAQHRLAHPAVFLIMLLPLCALAFVEEGLWDRWLWQDHDSFFAGWQLTPALASTTNWLVPLLALPQITHYLLDGFIWRRKVL